MERGYEGDIELFWGIRVWILYSDGSSKEVTSGTPVAQVDRSRTSQAEQVKSATWDCPETDLNTTDALRIRAYIKAGDGDWETIDKNKGFVTAHLGATKLQARTWTVHYHTYRKEVSFMGTITTYGRFYFGTLSKNSRIENIFAFHTSGSLNLAGNRKEGTYTALSRQKEDFCYVNLTVTGDPDSVRLNWFNGSWCNVSMSRQSGTDFWYKNMTNLASGIDYTFRVYSCLGDDHRLVYNHTKKAPYGKTVRKYFRCGCAVEDWEYVSYYAYNMSYDGGLGKDEFTRCLPHEQYADGTDYDTGLLRQSIPDNDYEWWCSNTFYNYADRNITIEETRLRNLYVHIWVNYGNDEIGLDIGYLKHTTGWFPSPTAEYNFRRNSDAEESIDTAGLGFRYDTYYLEANLWDFDDEVDFTDNDVYFLMIQVDSAFNYPSMISTQNYTSFYVVNVPNNTWLQNQDTDRDGLTDYKELYTYFTDPFDPDTDNGGEGDKREVDYGRNPLKPQDDAHANVYVTTKPNNKEGVLCLANVTVLRGSKVIASGTSNITGTVALTKMPFGNLTFVAYAKSDHSQLIANITVNIVSEIQIFDLICDQNYSDVSSNWELIMSVLSLSMLMAILPLLLLILCTRSKKDKRVRTHVGAPLSKGVGTPCFREGKRKENKN
jgi:hypothetical protein